MLVSLVVDIASIAKNYKMNKSFLLKLGKKIKNIRTEQHLTQDDVGINGISRSMVSLVELAKTDITVSKLKILANNLNVNLKDLFSFESD